MHLCSHTTLITMKVYDNDKAQDVTQVVECLHKTLGSDSSTIAGTTAHACNTWEIEYSSKEVTKEKKKMQRPLRCLST